VTVDQPNLDALQKSGFPLDTERAADGTRGVSLDRRADRDTHRMSRGRSMIQSVLSMPPGWRDETAAR
jgi:hypothetical protein